jgi:chaperone required for assembly of F1-ATPase
MRRFWDLATVAPRDAGFAILLDGKPMRLPGGVSLTVPGRVLAEAIAAEWQQAGGAIGGTISLADMPLTSLASTAQERIAPNPGPTIDAIAAYGGSDLLCYRAGEPEVLARRQLQLWQPWLDWAARALDAPLRVTTGLMPIAQPPDALVALHRAVASQPIAAVAALGMLVPALGSLVLGLAVVVGELTAGNAHELSILDERFQAEFWGEDDEAADRRHRVAVDLRVAERFLTLSRQDACAGVSP